MLMLYVAHENVEHTNLIEKIFHNISSWYIVVPLVTVLLGIVLFVALAKLSKNAAESTEKRED